MRSIVVAVIAVFAAAGLFFGPLTPTAHAVTTRFVCVGGNIDTQFRVDADALVNSTSTKFGPDVSAWVCL